MLVHQLLIDAIVHNLKSAISVLEFELRSYCLSEERQNKVQAEITQLEEQIKRIKGE